MYDVGKLKAEIDAALALLAGATGGTASPAGNAGDPTVFVDPVGGNDAADGATAATPWKTLTKLNATTFQPGDVIGLKAGTTFSGTRWNFAGSGTAEQPIWITRYGSGANPIMDGQNARQNLWIDGQEYVFVDSVDFINSNEGGSLAVRNVTSPFLVRGCGFRGNAFNVDGGALLVYNCSGGTNPGNLTLLDGPLRDVYGIARGSGGRITACAFDSNDNDGIWFGASPDIELDSNSITGITNAISDGIQADGNDAGASTRYSSNYWVHHNYVEFPASTNSAKGGFSSNAPNAGAATGFLGGMVEQNLIVALGGSTVGYGISVSNTNSVAQDNEVHGFGNGGNGAISLAGSTTTDGVQVLRNRIYDCVQGIFAGGGIRTNMKIEDNEIINASYRALWVGNDSCTGTSKRNKLWCPQLPTTTAIVRLPPGVGTAGVDSDYNEIGPEQANFINWNNTNYSTLAAYVTAATKDAHTRRLAV